MKKAPQEDPEGSILVRIGDNEEGQPAKFPRMNWRRALRAFLDGIWSQNNEHATGAIIIDGVTLFLHGGEYHIQWPPHAPVSRPTYARDRIHAVPSERKDVELGLVKFLLNNYKWQLVIEFPDARLMLLKGSGRTNLSICVVDRTF